VDLSAIGEKKEKKGRVAPSRLGKRRKKEKRKNAFNDSPRGRGEGGYESVLTHAPLYTHRGKRGE